MTKYSDNNYNQNYKRRKCSRYVCCAIDLNLAVRLIAFMGITISVLLMTVLLNDKYQKDYAASRFTALALGLDWQHYHKKANASQFADPNGELISVIVIFYSTLYLILNLLLMFASIAMNKPCAYSWLVCEFVSWVSKLGALIYHLNSDPEVLSKTFTVGSLFYIVVVAWWWIVVFIAQMTWKDNGELDDILSLKDGSFVARPTELELSSIPPHLKRNSITESPEPYHPNIAYCPI